MSDPVPDLRLAPIIQLPRRHTRPRQREESEDEAEAIDAMLERMDECLEVMKRRGADDAATD